MKERNKKIIAVISAVVVIGICIAIFFNELLLLFAPELYVKKALEKTYIDNQKIFSFLDSDVLLEYDMKVVGLYDKEIENKKYKGLSLSGDLSYESKENLQVSMKAGIGVFKPYEVSMGLDKEKILLDIPLLFGEPVTTDWRYVSKVIGRDINLFDNFLVVDYEKLFDTAQITCISKKDRKFKLVFKDEYNPIPINEFYLYIDKDLNVYKLENDIMVIDLRNDKDGKNFSFEVSKDEIGEIKMDVRFSVSSGENKTKVVFDSITTTYQGCDYDLRIELKGKISGKFISSEDKT